MARPTKLTAEVHRAIVELIRSGAFDRVAAEAARIHESTFGRWMEHGRKGQIPYRDFYDDVVHARAQARAVAEIEIKRDNPLAWLRYGPGRERPGRPGWTDSVKHGHSGPGEGRISIELLRQATRDANRVETD